MAYDKKAWRSRIGERTDLSCQVVHLTRDTSQAKVVDVLYNIASSSRLLASQPTSGFICGNRPAVCFQDAPLVSICQNVYYEQKYRKANPTAKMRYLACGIALPKEYVYRKGARPVLYDRTIDAKRILPKDEWWRIVNFDLSDDASFIDWTHEREWRAPGDFEFDLGEATLLFVNHGTLKCFAKICESKSSDCLLQAKGIVVMDNLLF
ncbi:MAG: hypothetical protein KF817_08330 [Phycisphaeraceae bacterium]|nr:hypothetical protein [Phycisphaeraceae bacterium]